MVRPASFDKQYINTQTTDKQEKVVKGKLTVQSTADKKIDSLERNVLNSSKKAEKENITDNVKTINPTIAPMEKKVEATIKKEIDQIRKYEAEANEEEKNVNIKSGEVSGANHFKSAVNEEDFLDTLRKKGSYYKKWKEGMVIPNPDNDTTHSNYVIAKVIDKGKGFRAILLISKPEKGKVDRPPLMVFRPTVPPIIGQGTLLGDVGGSVWDDLGIVGGLAAGEIGVSDNLKEIKKALKYAKKKTGQKVDLTGWSLGGGQSEIVGVKYPHLVNKITNDGGPGVTEKLKREFEENCQKVGYKPQVVPIRVKGDFIPYIGEHLPLDVLLKFEDIKSMLGVLFPHFYRGFKHGNPTEFKGDQIPKDDPSYIGRVSSCFMENVSNYWSVTGISDKVEEYVHSLLLQMSSS